MPVQRSSLATKYKKFTINKTYHLINFIDLIFLRTFHLYLYFTNFVSFSLEFIPKILKESRLFLQDVVVKLGHDFNNPFRANSF